MKKVLLGLGVLVTICNLTIGVAYSAVCQESTGGRLCGTECTASAGGKCYCSGQCTEAELQWLESGGGGELLQ